MELVPKQKKPRTGRPPEVVPVYFPDAKIDKLKIEIEKIIHKHGKGMTYAAVIGVLDMIKYEQLEEWKHT